MLRRQQYVGRAGFTLLELLISGFILVVIIAAAAAFFASSARSYELNERLSVQQQEIESAVKILSYDAALAGYRGTTLVGLSRAFTGAPIRITKGPTDGSDALEVRYFEDAGRLFGADVDDTCPCVECSVTYEVDSDDDGRTFLFRREGADRIGIVQAVEHFRVLQFILRDDDPLTIGETTDLPDSLSAITIEIAFENGGLWRFPVSIPNPVADLSGE